MFHCVLMGSHYVAPPSPNVFFLPANAFPASVAEKNESYGHGRRLSVCFLCYFAYHVIGPLYSSLSHIDFITFHDGSIRFGREKVTDSIVRGILNINMFHVFACRGIFYARTETYFTQYIFTRKKKDLRFVQFVEMYS